MTRIGDALVYVREKVYRQFDELEATLKQLQKQDFKDARYKCIIMLMYTLLDFEKRNIGLDKFGRNFSTPKDLADEIKAEWHNAILFASDEVLENLYSFIKNPSPASFKKTALSMRKDLWGGKLSATLSSLEF